MARKALVAQCGGPTAVINASLAAVIGGWQTSGGEIWGARNGLRGVASGDWLNLSYLSGSTLARLSRQTGAALGGGRDRLDEAVFAAALGRLRGSSIETLFLIGGNGTMAAAHALSQHAGGLVQVVGIPKTIDNDLVGSEVAPGYLSAAEFAMRAVRGAALDLRSMATFDDVAVVEVMGRHAGWLAAASALARSSGGDAPHILLLPEAPVDEAALLARIEEVHRAEGVCLVAASEGARNLRGEFLGEVAGKGEEDSSGQLVFAYAGGVAAWLAGRVRGELGLRCRQMRPDTLFRSGGGVVNALDGELAQLVAADGVAAALAGASDVMIGLRRAAGEGAAWKTALVPLAEVVGKERTLPAHFIAPHGMDVGDGFLQWAAGMFTALAAPVVLSPGSGEDVGRGGAPEVGIG